MPPAQAAQDDTPVHSQGFGAAEDADATRQAQHTTSNDAPTDVNFNAIVARSQALTVGIAGQNYEHGAQRSRSLWDAILGRLGIKASAGAEKTE